MSAIPYHQVGIYSQEIGTPALTPVVAVPSHTIRQLHQSVRKNQLCRAEILLLAQHITGKRLSGQEDSFM